MRAAVEIGIAGGRVPFVCECAETSCTEVLMIGLDEYASVREHPRRFLVAAGHEDVVGEVVSGHDGYVVIEKTGRAGEVSEELRGN